jgi:hypothetical protein
LFSITECEHLTCLLLLIFYSCLFTQNFTHDPVIRMFPLSFHCFENLTVPHAIQSWSSDQNVPLSFHCFENLTVLHAIQSWSSDQNVPVSFHFFENLTVLHAIQSWSSDQTDPLSFHCFENPCVLHAIQTFIVLTSLNILRRCYSPKSIWY